MMEGYLVKRSRLRKRDHLNIIFNERYFTLDDNRLSMYQRRGDASPRNTYNLTPDCTVSSVTENHDWNTHIIWIFRIRFPVETHSGPFKSLNLSDRYVELGAKTAELAQEWHAMISNAILRSKHQKTDLKRNLHRSKTTGVIPATIETVLKEDYSRGILRSGPSPKGVLDAIGSPAPAAGESTRKGEETGHAQWRVAGVVSGLRVMEEHKCAADLHVAQDIDQAITRNIIVLLSVVAFLFVGSLADGWQFPFALSAGMGVFASIAVLYGGSLFVDRNEVHPQAPSLRVQEVVRAAPQDIFMMLMELKNWKRWNTASSSVRVIQKLDDHSDVLHVVLRPVWLWPFWCQPRDLCIIRYWRLEEDGSFVIVFQSVEHPECRPRQGFVRAKLESAAFIIAPLRPECTIKALQSHTSLVTYVVRYDPGGSAFWWTRYGRGFELVSPFLQSVVAIRDEFGPLDFIEPTLTGLSDSTSPSERRDSLVDAQPKFKKLPTLYPTHFYKDFDPSKFNIRGPTYLTDKKKISSGPAAFNLVGVEVFSFEDASDRYNLAGRADSVVTLYNNENPDPLFTFIVNIVVPSAENLSLVSYYQPKNPNFLKEKSAFSELFSDFIEGDDSFRNNRFKLIPNIVVGPFIIKQTVGSKPAIIGNKGLRIPYFRGENYFEIDLDIASDRIANQVVGMVKGTIKQLVIDIAWMIEAQTQEELPETIIGTLRLEHIDLTRYTRIPRSTATTPTSS